MARTNSYRYSVALFLRMGELSVVELENRHTGRPMGSNPISRLDPASVGKAIHAHAVSQVNFEQELHQTSGIDQVLAQAIGAPNGENLDRTASMVFLSSDGHEVRFSGFSPGERPDGPRMMQFQARLSSGTPLNMSSSNLVTQMDNPFPIPPWRDAELLGQAVLNVFGFSGPPSGKEVMGSVFDPPEPKRRTALHRAARDEDMDSLPQPEGRKTRLDRMDSAGMTPMIVGAEQGHDRVVSRLLQLGAQADFRDHEGRTALHLAVKGGHSKTASALVKAGASVSLADRHGKTPLHMAVAGGYQEVVELLLDAGANPGSHDSMSSSTPLQRAARGNHAEIARSLMGRGASVDVSNEWGRTPLHVAAAFGGSETVEALLELGANPNGRDDRGETPLHLPSFLQHLDCMVVLISGGAEVDARDGDGNTPLHTAASMNLEQAADLLFEHGADLETVTTRDLHLWIWLL